MPAVLVEDVLDGIIKSCPISTVSVLSRASSHIRRLAIPQLVRIVCLDRSPKQVVGFLNFIIDNASNPSSLVQDPGRYVFSLELHESFAFRTYILHEGVYVVAENEEYRMAAWAPMLAQALKLMPNLRTFSLKGDTEDIANHSPDLAHSLLSLPQLTSLDLWSVGTQTSLLFDRAMDTTSIANSLHVLKVDGSNEDGDSTIILEKDGLGRFMLQNSKALKEVHFSSLDLTEFFRNYDRHNIQNNTQGIFPSVTELTIGSCDLSLEDLAFAFPSLHTLNLGYSKFLHQYYAVPPQDHISLPSLVSIEGRYKDIYSILKCNSNRDHVKRLVISYPWDNHDDDDTSPYAVPKIAPQLKSLHFTQKQIKPLLWWQGFGETLPALSYLGISIYSSSDDDWAVICNHIPVAISSIPLRYISVAVEEYVRVTTNPSFTEEPIAISFSKAIPTLQYIDVRKRNLSNYGSDPAQGTWWKVVRERNGSFLQLERLGMEQRNNLRLHYDLQKYYT